MNIPDVAWSRSLDADFEQPGRPKRASFEETIAMLPTTLRMNAYERRERRAGREPVMGAGVELNPGPRMGVPLGGLGGGSITRGWRGDFCRWGLQAGRPTYDVVEANQFALWARRPGDRAQAVVLNPEAPESGALSGWGWTLPAERCTYHALFPRAWTTYRSVIPGINVTCRQISPVLPGDYETSSLPAAVFVFAIENTGDTVMETGLLFTLQNGTGTDNDRAGGHYNVPFEQPLADGGTASGVLLHHLMRTPKPVPEGDPVPEVRTQIEDPLTFAMGALQTEDVEVTYRARWITSGSGMGVWGDFIQDGKLENEADDKPSTDRYSIGGAVCASLEIPPGETREVAFVLAWDMPLARFGGGRAWYRRYTRFYGKEGDAAPRIAADALAGYTDWELAIEGWQQSVLDDPDLPDWYKSALFNELYFLVDGGTIWTDGRPAEDEDEDPLGEDPELGHFALLESHEYRMYNTYDVYFYASWALAQLWPDLDRTIQQDTAAAVPLDIPDEFRAIGSGGVGIRKVPGAVPHDLGSPVEDPWMLVNSYTYQDTTRWKDLNPKFVLQIYRHFAMTGSRDLLETTWDAVQDAMEYAAEFDEDGDAMIENEGIPDQTYDNWKAKGVSAYTGGLWVAALHAAAAIAEELGHTNTDYAERAERAAKIYDTLYNGEYYDYDTSRGQQATSIMADQIAGQWYARACGLPDIIPEENAVSALRIVHEFNVMSFEQGTRGAVNGMTPEGRVDTSSQQSTEVWTGTTFAVAAAMLHHGLDQEAWQTAHGIYRTIYADRGLHFMTPEAWNLRGNYRASSYMRPLAIWAMHWAWTQRPDFDGETG
ncbi:MAG: hypothetical protein GYB64_20295 [Chloroflexi bacterium]|nr:hypothetical protein [Chloroflexota bacterium]